MASESFGLQIEALYSQQGLQSDATAFFPVANLKLDYLNIPVMAKFYILKSGLAIELGPKIGFIVNEEFEVGNEVITDDLNANKVDLSAAAGLSYKFKAGVLEGLSFSTRYTHGLNNVYDDNETFGDNVNNINLQFSLGYSF